ncbi:MAG: pentapeptide repeat-containing protein [Acidimicrobiales bacterium]
MRPLRLLPTALGSLAIVAASLVPASPAAAACGDAAAAGVNWVGCNRSFAQLNGADLRRANLADVDLSYAALFQVDLSGANLRRADFQDAFPVGADLSSADATEANFAHADLVAANLEGTVLRGADLRRADLDFARLAGADFTGAQLAGVDFTGATGGAEATFLVGPDAADDLAVALGGTATTIDLLGNDDRAGVNRNTVNSVLVVDGPRHGTFDAASGAYRPAEGWRGVDTFTYRPVARIDGVTLPAGAETTVAGEIATATVRTVRPVAVTAPWAGRSGVEGEVVRLYVAAFNRQPDQGGFDFWVGRRQAGVSLVDVAAAFLQSDEWASFADVDDATFVDLAYLSVFGRRADAGGRAFWIGQLGDGHGRDRMLASFAQADEFKALTGTS